MGIDIGQAVQGEVCIHLVVKIFNAIELTNSWAFYVIIYQIPAQTHQNDF